MKLKRVIGGVFVLAAFSTIIAFACDNKGPSTSEGACAQGARICSDYTDPTGCTSRVELVYQINQNFPNDCVTVTNSLCNTPSAHCKIAVFCEWINGACQTVPGSDAGHVWDSVPKRTPGTCKP